jgi:hypothetical protein
MSQDVEDYYNNHAEKEWGAWMGRYARSNLPAHFT